MFNMYLKFWAKVFNVKQVCEYGKDKYPDSFMAFIYISMAWFVIRLFAGIILANYPENCRLKSIGDVIIAPAYTIGCNIGKDRFDIKVN